MLRERSTLQRLIAFASDERTNLHTVIPPGPMRDVRGVPRLMVESAFLPDPCSEPQIRAVADDLLRLGSASPAMLEARLNGRDRLRCVVFSPPLRQQGLRRPVRDGQSLLVPVVQNATEIPAAILLMALLTPTGTGDSLADRLSVCRACLCVFLSKSRRTSRYCTQRCRNSDKRPDLRIVTKTTA